MNYNIGDRIKDEKRDIEIIDCKRHNGILKYKYLCNVCGWNCEDFYENGILKKEYWLSKYHLNKGSNCLCCTSRVVVKGINDLYTTNPELDIYFYNKNDMYKYTKGSGKYIKTKCPKCGAIKYITVKNLVNHGFSCLECSDGISYPNKFVLNFLNQLNVLYIREKSFDWSCKKIYDFYLPDYNLVIENHGMQHYDVEFMPGISSRTLKEEKENDIFKKTLAENQSIKYISIDCRYSTLDWIKSSILKSELVKILNIKENEINWVECDRYASDSSIIKEVCNYWKNNKENITKTSEYYKMDVHTIQEYLIKGNKCGYCNYQKYNIKSKSNSSKQSNSKPIFCHDDNIYFFSKKECEEYYRNNGDLNVYGKSLYNYINKNKPYHNLKFSYVTKNKYNEQKFLYDMGIGKYKVIGNLYDERYIKEVI